MERLTVKSQDTRFLERFLNNRSDFDGTKIAKQLNRLKDYEDTGITPDGIEDIKACLDVNGDGHSGADTLDDLLELMQYRKTGLTPKQIKEIDKLYLEKCQEVNRLYDQMMQNEKDFAREKEESLTALELAQIYATLNHYKKLEEQGRLIELPCKVGDTVYEIFDGEIYEYKSHEITLDSYNKRFCYDSLNISLDDIGKTIFITREEAEQALKESN